MSEQFAIKIGVIRKLGSSLRSLLLVPNILVFESNKKLVLVI